MTLPSPLATAFSFPAHSRLSAASGGIFLSMAALVAFAAPGMALEKKKGEAERLIQCEAEICGVILDRKTQRTGVNACTIDKTWVRRDIKKGARYKKIKWSFGDAQCTVTLKFDRAVLFDALRVPKYKVRMERHYINCIVERSKGVDTVRVEASPILNFKNGRVKKVWINVKKVKAPSGLWSLIWTTAKLEDKTGLFHEEMVDEINDFIHNKCEKRHGAKAKLIKAKAEEAKAKKAKAKLAKAKAKKTAADKDGK